MARIGWRNATCPLPSAQVADSVGPVRGLPPAGRGRPVLLAGLQGRVAVGQPARGRTLSRLLAIAVGARSVDPGEAGARGQHPDVGRQPPPHAPLPRTPAPAPVAGPAAASGRSPRGCPSAWVWRPVAAAARRPPRLAPGPGAPGRAVGPSPRPAAAPGPAARPARASRGTGRCRRRSRPAARRPPAGSPAPRRWARTARAARCAGPGSRSPSARRPGATSPAPSGTASGNPCRRNSRWDPLRHDDDRPRAQPARDGTSKWSWCRWETSTTVGRRRGGAGRVPVRRRNITRWRRTGSVSTVATPRSSSNVEWPRNRADAAGRAGAAPASGRSVIAHLPQTGAAGRPATQRAAPAGAAWFIPRG